MVMFIFMFMFSFNKSSFPTMAKGSGFRFGQYHSSYLPKLWSVPRLAGSFLSREISSIAPSLNLWLSLPFSKSLY